MAQLPAAWTKSRKTGRWAVRLLWGAGISLLVYTLLAPKESGVPGWQPVNEQLRATLAEESAASPPAHSAMPAAPSLEPAASASVKPASPLLDLNAAGEAELTNLPGIGPAKAKAIAAYRKEHGGFRSVDELLAVKGIGPALLGRIRSLVTVKSSAAAP